MCAACSAATADGRHPDPQNSGNADQMYTKTLVEGAATMIEALRQALERCQLLGVQETVNIARPLGRSGIVELLLLCTSLLKGTRPIREPEPRDLSNMAWQPALLGVIDRPAVHAASEDAVPTAHHGDVQAPSMAG